MLFAHSRDKMIEYLHSVLDQVENFGEMIQLIVIEVIARCVVITNNQDDPQDR
jgi:hypothetical protein